MSDISYSPFGISVGLTAKGSRQNYTMMMMNREPGKIFDPFAVPIFMFIQLLSYRVSLSVIYSTRQQKWNEI